MAVDRHRFFRKILPGADCPAALADSERFHKCRRSAYPLLWSLRCHPILFYRGWHFPCPLPPGHGNLRLPSLPGFSRIRRMCLRFDSASAASCSWNGRRMPAISRRRHAVHAACRMLSGLLHLFSHGVSTPILLFSWVPFSRTVPHGMRIPVPSFLDFQKSGRPVFSMCRQGGGVCPYWPARPAFHPAALAACGAIPDCLRFRCFPTSLVTAFPHPLFFFSSGLPSSC